MSNNADLFKEGDRVTLANNAVNRCICQSINISIIGKVGEVQFLELRDDFVEKCVVIGNLIVLMKYFPIWHIVNE